VGVPAVSGFLSWLRNGRTVEHVIARDAEIAPSPETLEARLAALISFYRWHGSVNDVPVAGKLLHGRPRRAPARGLLSHPDSRSEAQPSSLVRVRTIKHSDRPPLLLPHQVQAILDGCAVYDPQTGEWQGNLRDRFLFALLAETGMRLGEALGMRINEFVMGRGGTPYLQVVPREDNPNGARVKMLRPRRIYVGADLERLYADYLTHLACRAAEFGIPVSPDELQELIDWRRSAPTASFSAPVSGAGRFGTPRAGPTRSGTGWDAALAAIWRLDTVPPCELPNPAPPTYRPMRRR